MLLVARLALQADKLQQHQGGAATQLAATAQRPVASLVFMPAALRCRNCFGARRQRCAASFLRSREVMGAESCCEYQLPSLRQMRVWFSMLTHALCCAMGYSGSHWRSAASSWGPGVCTSQHLGVFIFLDVDVRCWPLRPRNTHEDARLPPTLPISLCAFCPARPGDARHC